MSIELLYLLAAVLFILGIKGLTRVRTARRGNLLSALGMLVAVITTLLAMETLGWQLMVVGVLIGAIIGGALARLVKMTAMPELVAVFNGLGGGASLLVALSYHLSGAVISSAEMITVLLSVVIGAVTLTGSLIAFGKLAGWVKAKPLMFPGSKALNLILGLSVVGIALLSAFAPGDASRLLITALVAALLGILLVTPIGGADMPVVVSLLNSYSGLAAAMTGFVLGNSVLIISGALVGASGLILTRIMCKAMNRSLLNVLFGGFGGEASSEEHGEYATVLQTSPEEVALLLDGVKSVIIIPGYGLAVAQAQFAAQELAELLGKRDVRVSYAIHPVAGRMPGHMNVLLAEANVPYKMLKDLDHINSEFKNTDAVLVLGANDVVNPEASNPQSPIAGMPILKAHEARQVIVIKRSLSPGFAGIKNPLFEKENTRMLFMDAKAALQQINVELEEM